MTGEVRQFEAAGLGATHRGTTQTPEKGRRRWRNRRVRTPATPGSFSPHTTPTTSDVAHRLASGTPTTSGLYYGYFENRYGEQFVFTFDRATGTGTVSGGDLGWGDPKSFTLGLLEEVVRDTQRVAAQIAGPGRTETSGLLVIDAALALGRVTGLTGKDEVIWLRACRKRPGMAATRSWSDAYLQSPISPIIFLTRAFGPVPIRVQEGRTRPWMARSTLIREIPVHVGCRFSLPAHARPQGVTARPCASSSGGTSR